MTVDVPDEWCPFPGPQTEFLRQSCREALYGGAAGGGKSIALLMGAARFVRHRTYRAILLRRTTREAKRTIADTAHLYYPALGGRPSGSVWHFPSGATVEFGGIEHEQDVYRYNSAEFQYIGFDELSTFTQWQYEYLSSRLRGAQGDEDWNIPWFLRSGTNPLGPHVEWVRRRFRWWTYRPGDGREDEFSGPYARPGQVLHILRDASGEEHVVAAGTPKAQGRVFIPARLDDNPYLRNTDYGDQLDTLDPVTRKQLREGDWSVRVEPGKFLRRVWFRIEAGERVELPDGRLTTVAPGVVVARVRFWDRAATAPEPGKDPCWTVGLRLALTSDGRFWVEDVRRAQAEPGAIIELVRDTADLDEQLSPRPSQVLEQEGGSAGMFEVAYYVRELAGVHVVGVHPTTDKVARARPVAAQAAPPTSNVYLVAAPWNGALLEELESFPSKSFHNDQVDALSGAFAYLSPQRRMRRGPGALSPTGFKPGAQTEGFQAAERELRRAPERPNLERLYNPRGCPRGRGGGF